MIRKSRPAAQKGSRRWALHVAEIAAWGTAGLIFLILNVAEFDSATYTAGLALVGALVVWIVGLFHLILPRVGNVPWVAWVNLLFGLAFSSGAFALMREEVPSAQLVFLPVIATTSIVGTLPYALAAAVLAAGSYLGVERLSGEPIDSVAGAFNVGIFLLVAAVSGLLSRELRSHYRAEQEEHRLATAVRHRLLAVLDAVDEAIVFRDRQGMVRVINRRAGELFDIEPDDYLGVPAVELLRKIARSTEDPEGFMETFQTLRDDPVIEIRSEIDQILPDRRQLHLYSGPALDESEGLVGRIDVYTDVSESVRRAAEIERLFESARKTAESYQRSLLPDSLPSLPRISAVAHYVPAAGRRAVCGDFYDFVPLPDGRVGTVLGDVCGIGPPAANDAALTRYTLRSFADDESDPGKLVERLNAHIYKHIDSERFVRLMVGVLDPERAIFEYANAGHVPPVVYHAKTGEVEWLGEGGIALAIEDDSTYKVGRVEMSPGDMLILYTDGVTEAPRNGRPLGQGKFSDLVKEYGVGTPGELVQAIRRYVEKWVSGGELRDDLALIVYQVVPDTTTWEPMRELVLPNEPARMAEVRRFVAGFLADLRAPVEVSSEILIAVGEAAANACRHGRNPDGRSEMRLRCVLEGPEVVVTVADDGPGFDPREVEGRERDRFASGGRGLFLMRTLMDSMTVDSAFGGTTITMTRRVFPIDFHPTAA